MQGHPDSGSCPHSAVCYVHSLSCPDQVWGCPNPRERRTQAHLESGEEGAQCTASGLNTGGLHHRDKDKGVGALPAAQSRGAASRPPTEVSFEVPSCRGVGDRLVMSVLMWPGHWCPLFTGLGNVPCETGFVTGNVPCETGFCHWMTRDTSRLQRPSRRGGPWLGTLWDPRAGGGPGKAICSF